LSTPGSRPLQSPVSQFLTRVPSWYNSTKSCSPYSIGLMEPSCPPDKPGEVSNTRFEMLRPFSGTC
jgi:hypothetical protein